MKPHVVAALFACIVCGAPVVAGAQTTTVKGWKIVERYVPRVGSGVFHVWATFAAASGDKKLHFATTYFGEGQELPQVGQTCDIEFHSEDIQGLIGARDNVWLGANVVDTVKCGG